MESPPPGFVSSTGRRLSRLARRGPLAKRPHVIDGYPSLYCGSGNVDVLEGRTEFPPRVRLNLRKFVREHGIVDEWSSGSEDEYDLSEKVIVVGDCEVGKTALAVRLVNDEYNEGYRATIGVNFLTKKYIIHGVRLLMNIWDTAGQERFQSLSRTFYRNSVVCVLCFDLGKPLSLEHTRDWLDEVRREVRTSRDELVLFLVGTKKDLYRTVSGEEGCNLAQEIGAEYWECSALTNENVTELFDRVAIVLFERSVCEYGKDESGSGRRKGKKLSSVDKTSRSSSCC